MSFVGSPDAGLSGPCILPENREQYQKFGHDDHFLLGRFDESQFLKFLDITPPESVPDVDQRGQKSFLTLANMLADFIKNKHFPKHDPLVFEDTGSNSLPGHVTDTKCKPDITAALQGHWKNGVVPWPFIRLAGETASAGKNSDSQRGQADSYLHYLLLARPDLYVAQGLLSSSKTVTFLFGIGGEGIREFPVDWVEPDLNRLLYAFIYRLYDPGDFADPSYVETEVDEDTTARYTINIAYQGDTKQCRGFYPIYARNPFATRTHVLSNPDFELGVNKLTVLKDQLRRVERRFDELTILNKHVHKSRVVPGVVVAAYGEKIKPPLSKERCKYRLGLGESGSPFTSIPTLSEVLETLFDVLEVLRYLRLHCNVLHRDISSGNVLYVENSSNHPPPPNSAPVSPEAKTNELPLCYAKYLLKKSINPLETSMLLVDFNLAEYLGPERSFKKRIDRTGTPIFIARAVERGKPEPPALFPFVPGIPNSPDRYAAAHPDRMKAFPSSTETLFNPRSIDNNGPHGVFKHELNHDAESVFWLLLYWAMLVQPEKCSKENINPARWCDLNGNYESRQGLPILLSNSIPLNTIHSLYKPLHPLITDLAAILVIDTHWLPESDRRKDPFYITEAFQRLILKFIIDNRDKEFMDHRVEKTFRKVQGMLDSYPSSSTLLQSLDAANRGVIPGTDDVEMDNIQ